MKNFIHLTDLSINEIQDTLADTLDLKKNRSKENKLLSNQSYGLLFYKSSTRTRVSFEVGIQELGGHAIILNSQSTQIERGESVKDTAKVLSRYLHGLVIRAYDHCILEEFSKYSTIPIINGLTDFNHPCQILTDIFTLLEKYDPNKVCLSALKDKKIVFVGDTASNMANSWILASAYLGFELVLAGPEKYQPSALILNKLKMLELNPKHRFTTDAKDAAKDADVIYTDVWVSMGDESEAVNRTKTLKPYQVNDDMVSIAKPDVLFLHCLPAHPGEEVTLSVLEGPRSIVYDQAENRLHTQKALIANLVK